MFKALTLYKTQPGWAPSLEQIEEALQAQLFVPCAGTQDKSCGWVPPRGEEHGPLVEAVAGALILKFRLQSKSVPRSMVISKAQEEADHIEKTTGRKPGRKETKALREDALMALLPQAFPRDSSSWIWIDREKGWLVTDASSQGMLDAIITALVRVFDGVNLSLVQTNVTPQTGMTQWLSAADAEGWPDEFSIERECELKSGDEEKSVVRFNRHNLATEEVRKHIAEGKLPTRVAMSWDGRVSFVLTEGLQLKKIAYLDGVFEDRNDGHDDSFDADVALSTGELSRLIPKLIEALGGEMTLAQTPAEAGEALAA